MRVGFRVKPMLVGEHLIPDKAATAEGFFKKLRLLRSRVEPDFNCGKPHRLPAASLIGFQLSRHRLLFPFPTGCGNKGIDFYPKLPG